MTALGLRRPGRWLLVGLAALALLVTTQTVAPAPAHAASCYASGCDLLAVGETDCARTAGIVDSVWDVDGWIRLWYSRGCNANWGEFYAPHTTNVHELFIYSQSPAPNNNSSIGWAGEESILTLMVDGRYLAEACGEVAIVGNDNFTCGNPH